MKPEALFRQTTKLNSIKDSQGFQSRRNMEALEILNSFVSLQYFCNVLYYCIRKKRTVFSRDRDCYIGAHVIYKQSLILSQQSVKISH